MDRGIESEHFKYEELRCHCGCGVNACTQGLVDALELIRSLSGNRPVQVDCAYRCPLHNASLPNAVQHSQHELGTAADIVVKDLTPAQMEAVAVSVPAIKGLGRADHQGYIHVDVRETEARWCYDANGYEVPYYSAPVVS
jgi:zinc D-Ala-D-Ala carboxypeptidase